MTRRNSCVAGLLLPSRNLRHAALQTGAHVAIKSVSAAAGLGPEVVRRDDGCALCRKEDCCKRRLKQP